MSIRILIYVVLLTVGALAGNRFYRFYRAWRFGRNGLKKGDKITCTIVDANGEHEYSGFVKKVKKTTITLDEH